MAYSSAIREAALRKLCASHSPSASSVAREFGMDPKTLQKWRKWGRNKPEEGSSKPMRQQDWSLEKRFQVVIETSSMNDEEIGAYCRRHGIHANTIVLWRETCLNTIRERSKDESETVALKVELKEVKRDLKRKEKALAEAAARLILQKKMKELWGSENENVDEEDI